MKRILVLLLLSVWMIPLVLYGQGQKKYSLEGKVLVYGSEEPIPYAQVLITELNVWGTTGPDGGFKIEGILPGAYSLETYALGYERYALPVKITKDVASFKIALKQDNLQLDEVVVTAKSGKGMNSSSKVNKNAIEHLQATSLSDVMQLVPGNLITNPSLTSTNSITIRSVNSSTINAEGVGVLINGAKVSGNASLSSTAPMDFRKISTDNIESVEVLKGVVSAEYGDITSGAVLITTKAGKTPFEFRVKSDPKAKAFSASKGFAVSEKGGNVNFDVDYARAFKDWISPVDVYNRTTLGITYSNTFNVEKNPFRFNARVSGYLTNNDVESDPDVSKEDFKKVKDNNLSVAMYGSWLLNKPWITSMNYNLSANYGYQYTQDYQIVNKNPLPTTNTTAEGVGLGYFTKLQQQQDQRIEDIPIYLNAKITGNLNNLLGSTFLKSMVGFEWNTRGNNGKGIYYEKDLPQYFRERRYSDIPYMSDLNVFAEEKMKLPIGKTSLEVVAGARLTKMFISGYSYDANISPRFNAKYSIVQEKRSGIWRSLSVRGGWGILQRLPSIGYLYPNPTYLDNVLFQYSNSTTGQSMALIQTSILDNKLPYNLKPVKTTNAEFGIDFNISGVKGSLTYFNEKLKDGITSNYSYITEDYTYYNTVTDLNAAPIYENGKIMVKDGSGQYVELGSRTSREFKTLTRSDNRGRIDKWGIEYDFNFGRIKALKTSILVNGAYIRTKDYSSGVEYFYSKSQDPINPKEKFPFVAVFDSQDGMSMGLCRDRLSTSINLVTNIPSVRMVVSLTTQCVWMNRMWNIYDEGKIYTLDANNNPVYGDYNNRKNMATMYRDPVAFMDMNGNMYDFKSIYHTTTDPDLKRRLLQMVSATNQTTFFLKTSYNPYFMANIRITKELGDMAGLSFYANNFTNSNPLMKDNARPTMTGLRMNTGIYFGAELRLTFK